MYITTSKLSSFFLVPHSFVYDKTINKLGHLIKCILTSSSTSRNGTTMRREEWKKNGTPQSLNIINKLNAHIY